MFEFVNKDETCGNTEFAFWNTPDRLADQRWTFEENMKVVTIPITAQILEEHSRARVTVVIYCQNTCRRIIPRQQIYACYREQGSTCWFTGWFTSGQSVVWGLRAGITYEVQAYYNGRWMPDTPYLYTVSPDYVAGTLAELTFEFPTMCAK